MLFLTLIVGALLAQQEEFRFTTSSNLVIVNVSVEDRRGNPVEGLKKEDFAVFEDGKPQAISVFDYQKLSFDPLPLAPPPLSPRLFTTLPKAEQPEEAAAAEPAPATIRYQDRRLLVFFFDFTSMNPIEQARAQDAALKFLQEQMTAADLVSIMTFTNRLKVEQDFTDDRETLGEIIRSFRIGEIEEMEAAVETGEEEEAEEDPNTLFIADETEFNIFNTDRKLSALESAVRSLAALPEKKALIYFSSGVSKTGVENQAQLLATINAAVRANVAFYPIDVRGLTALPPGGDASRAAPRGTAIFSGKAQREQKMRFNDQQETLYSLAAETGGKALLDSNDLSLGIVQAQRDLRSYYILGYYSTNQTQDGRFRRIQVRLHGDRNLKLAYRPGYFAPKEFKYFTAADKERQLEEALQLGDPVTDLPLALEVNYFRLPGNRYFVPVAVKIPGSYITLVRKGGAQTAEFDFIGQVRDTRKRLVGSVRDTIRVKLDPSAAGLLGRRHLNYDTGFTLPAGQYRIKFLARDNQSGKMGTFETGFTIPDLNAPDKMLHLSSVVWSNQREPVSAAVGAAEKKSDLLAQHPLVEEGKKLIPSVTRVFRRRQNLYVYFEAYDPALDPESKAPSVAASLSVFRGTVKVFESAPVRLTQSGSPRPGTLPFELQAPLEKLPPGRYTCQVNVVDEIGRKFAFARAPIVVLN